MEELNRGLIVFLQQKRFFGFIKETDDTQVFFHASAVIGTEFDDLREGMLVEYYKESTPKGNGFKAIGVYVLEREVKSC